MSAQVLELPVRLVTVNCGVCGGVYAINERYHEHHRERGGYWRCPYGEHSWGFDPQGSELAQLKRKLAEEEARKQRALVEANEQRAAREKAERKLKRVARGACPCCKRTFVNLARHMAAKHPEEASA